MIIDLRESKIIIILRLIYIFVSCILGVKQKRIHRNVT